MAYTSARITKETAELLARIHLITGESQVSMLYRMAQQELARLDPEGQLYAAQQQARESALGPRPLPGIGRNTGE
jgi:hypothetical protein